MTTAYSQHPVEKLRGAAWRTSTRSQTSNCVEVAPLGTAEVAVRDSKDRTGPVLIFTRTQWLDFLTALRAAEFDLDG